MLGNIKTVEFDKRLSEIKRFEKMLADEGALIFKFWFHLSQQEQKVEANDKNYRRIKILTTVCQRLEAAIKGKS